MAESAIRVASKADIEALGAVLGAAFDDDPVINWFVRQDERRSASITALFREVTRHAYLGDGETYLATDDAGAGLAAAVWRPPGVAEPPPIAALEQVFDAITDEAGRQRLNELGALMDPSERHRYLFAIGVQPAAQGGGMGSRIIRTVLDRCDEDGVPAYLENSKERNLPFYERHGFRAMERAELPGGGPSMWLMWREPGAVG